MAQRIVSVDGHSPASRAGLRAGDELLRIDGEVVYDLLDYQVLSAKRRLTLSCRRDGQPFDVSVRKGEYDSLGLNFAQPLMSGLRLCCNNCLFCFVDQLPKNLRPSLRVKDDDWRLSLMTGSYVTLTNVSDRELGRIITRHASPLYISVHAADPVLRGRILGSERGGRLMSQLKKLSDGGIEFHCQAVLCPGLNDGAALDETIAALTGLRGARSLALVPVGLTGHREGLAELHTYTPEQAGEVLNQAERWRQRLLAERGTRFVFPADEFYLIAGVEPPPDEAYEGYEQIDDGVGMLRLLQTEFHEAWLELPAEERTRTESPAGGYVRLLIGCGVSAADFLRKLMEEHPLRGVDVRVVAVQNRLFGPSVTVSGLVCGRDLAEQLRAEPGERVLITECMLRDGGDRFLDDLTLADVEARLGRLVVPVGRRGDELLAALFQARDAHCQ